MKDFQKEINKNEIAKELEIELRTLYNWEKKRIKLYNFIVENFKNKNEKNKEVENNSEILEIFSKLNEKEKEFYLLDMKARILKKELQWNFY